MCVLLRASVSLDRVRDALAEFELVGRHDSELDTDSATTLVYQFRDDAGGHLLVTLSDAPWPDDLGDPDTSPERFIAWSLGQYGPYAFPGCLRRAGEQSWGWDEGHEVVTSHQCHIRFLISYVLGPGELEAADDEAEAAEAADSPLVPEDYDPLKELQFLTRAVEPILAMPEAICYFNPGGEMLCDVDGLRRGLNHAWSQDVPPLEMWTNVRLFRATEQWSLMDTVGNAQLDLPDVEAIFENEKYDAGDVERFLRSASLYLLDAAEDVEDGDTADGPGDVQWMAMECGDGLSDPPRETIRWIPQDDSSPPDELLDPGFDEEEMVDEEEDDEI